MIGYVALGGNVGGEAAILERFRQAAALLPAVKMSRVYRSKPVGPVQDQPEFLNAVAAIETDESAEQLIARLLEIEKTLGRVRDVPGGPRTIDLDLIALGDQIVDEDGVKVPHPRALVRPFVLVPLRDVAGDDYVLPGQKQPLSVLCVDELQPAT